MNGLEFHEKFVFRSPTYSFIEINKFSNQLDKLITRNDFLEAIYISSSDLYHEIVRWASGELKDQKKIIKLSYSIYKFLSRMSSRCTPYGQFAFCSTGLWKEESKIILSWKEHRTRLDMSFFCDLANDLSSQSTIRQHLLFFPNNSVYTIGSRLRYIEYKYFGKEKKYQTNSVDKSEYLKKVFESSKSGKTISELSHLLKDKEINYETAKSFINEIIESQLLVSELEPSITGGEIINQFLAVLNKINNIEQISKINDVITLLDEVSYELKKNNSNLKSQIYVYKNMHDSLKAMQIPIGDNALFQVDAFGKFFKSALNINIQNKLLSAIGFLQKTTPNYPNNDLNNFKKKYLETYEEKEMPLAEVLDTEMGIGFPSKDINGINVLVDDLAINLAKENSTLLRNKFEDFTLGKLKDAFKNEEYSVNFTKDNVMSITNPDGCLPLSFSIIFRMINCEEGKVQLNLIGGGSSAANLLSRFAYGDENIFGILKDITAFEQKILNDKIVAEVVHLPESRLGNILIRPIVRNYEIPFLSKSAVPVCNQIHIEDILVSIKNNRIIIRSKRLNKEILPRLSTAHNYSYNGLPIYRFLGDLQLQDIEKPALGFSWGSLAHTFSFLPRAEYNDVVLFPATWNLSAQDYSALVKNISKEDFSAEVKAWQEKWKMPKWIVLKDGDNELLVDFENELSIKTFFNEIKKRPSIQVSEFLFDPENALVKDDKGNPYTNEIIAIVFNNDFKSIPSPDFSNYNAENKLPVKRSFIPGSEWLYYKIYCGVKTADDILATTIKPLVEQLSKSGLIEKWFFIRYADPDTHIRLRFFNNDPSKLNEVTKIVSQYLQPFHEQGIIPKIQTDTYTRELERYGNTSIELAEDYFSIDSWATLNFLQIAQGDSGEELKWQFALKSVDELMDVFSFSQEQKLNFIETLSKNFIAEHSTDKSLKVQLDNKFRKMRSQVNDLFDNESTKGSLSFSPLLEWKKNIIQPIANQILKLEQEGNLEVPLNDLLASFLHMTLNRIFKAKQRTHEMVIYDLLYRYLKSKLAREKNKI